MQPIGERCGALPLSTQFGLISAGAYLLSGAVVTLLALRLNRQWEMRRADEGRG